MSQTDSPATPPNPPRSRLEDEVLEILHRAERPESLAARLQRGSSRYRGEVRRQTSRLQPPTAIGPGLLLLGSLGLAILGAALSGWVPILGVLAGLLSFVLLVLIWAPSVGGTGSTSKRWRGRNLDPSQGDPEWLKDVRRRFRRPPFR